MGTPAESPLAPAILRGLGDRSYDKRKNAALEIEALIKTLDDTNETDRICAIIVLLGQDFATSTNPNHRKGGLIGLAASSIGLMSVGVGGFVALFSLCKSSVSFCACARRDAEHLKITRVDQVCGRQRREGDFLPPLLPCPSQVYKYGTQLIYSSIYG